MYDSIICFAAYAQPLLHNRENLQATIVSLIQNETAMNSEGAWLDVGQKVCTVKNMQTFIFVYSFGQHLGP